jgi:hypothetical protein
MAVNKILGLVLYKKYQLCAMQHSAETIFVLVVELNQITPQI